MNDVSCHLDLLSSPPITQLPALRARILTAGSHVRIIRRRFEQQTACVQTNEGVKTQICNTGLIPPHKQQTIILNIERSLFIHKNIGGKHGGSSGTIQS